MNSRRRFLLLCWLLCFAWVPNVSDAQTTLDVTVDAATMVLDEIMSVPAKQIPQSLLADARGVAIIPNVVKGGFVVGVRHGRGVVLLRDDAGTWGPPMFASLSGGSVGWQVGIQATDVVLIFRTRKSIEGLMNDKLTIGVDAAAAAGPVGRQAAAATDARLGAEILSYSRSRGLFAGVSIDGSMIQLDHLAGRSYYGTPVVGADGEAIRNAETLPPSAIRLMNRLSQYSGSPPVAVAAIPPNAGPPVNAAELRHAELVRQQLVASWLKLSAIVDERWRDFLVPPGEVLAGRPVETPVLQAKLQQYTQIASDQRYAALSQRPEFAAMHQLLREYTTLQSAQSAATITLPPPPDRGN